MRAGCTDTAFLRQGEQRVGGGEQEGVKIGEGGGAQSRSTHLVCVEKRIGENSTLRDLSPISVETADKGMTCAYKPEQINKNC